MVHAPDRDQTETSGGTRDCREHSKDGVNGNDTLDGGAGTNTKVTDTTEKSIVRIP